MLYWHSNTGTTASIDYTNRSLDGACFIGGATLEQQHPLITQQIIGQSMLYWHSNTGTTACIDYANGALDGACYIGGATLEQQHVLIKPTEHWTEHVILAEQHWNYSMY